jgi:GT2 family glycosyltransferase
MYAQRGDVGAVGVKLYYPDDTIQHSGLIINLCDYCASNYDNKAAKESYGYMHCLSMVRNYSAVTAACMMMKRNDFIAVNGFNEELFKIGLNDVDICLMLREKNKLIVFTPYAELYHFEGASRGRDYEDANLRKRFLTESNNFRKKWRKYFEEGDPYFYKNEY